MKICCVWVTWPLLLNLMSSRRQLRTFFFLSQWLMLSILDLLTNIMRDSIAISSPTILNHGNGVQSQIIPYHNHQWGLYSTFQNLIRLVWVVRYHHLPSWWLKYLGKVIKRKVYGMLFADFWDWVSFFYLWRLTPPFSQLLIYSSCFAESARRSYYTAFWGVGPRYRRPIYVPGSTSWMETVRLLGSTLS